MCLQLQVLGEGMSKTLLSSPKYITWFFSPLRDYHLLLQNLFLFFLTTFCSLTLFSYLRVLMPVIGLFRLKRVTPILICVTGPNDEVHIPIYQHLHYCQFDEQHTYRIHQKHQKPTLSRRFSCLKEQNMEHGTSHILYIPATANRSLTTLKCECSAHSWWTLGYASFCTGLGGSAI